MGLVGLTGAGGMMKFIGVGIKLVEMLPTLPLEMGRVVMIILGKGLMVVLMIVRL